MKVTVFYTLLNTEKKKRVPDLKNSVDFNCENEKFL